MRECLFHRMIYLGIMFMVVVCIGNFDAWADPIKTQYGYVSGTTVGESDNAVRIYRGIPYGAPPVGELRWKPPQPPRPWSGIRECTVFPDWPAQGRGPWPPQTVDEADALFLNVLTPARNATDRLPVMVWIHGGGYGLLSGTQQQYNYPDLPQKGVVVVTVSSRLGVFGLVAHPLLSKESGRNASGNYMLLDLQAALKWVNRNIAAFGGDPNNVTIFGNSGGSAKCIDLMASPLSRGLFHRVIAQSGATSGKLLIDMEKMGTALFAKLGVDKDKDPLKSARALSWEKIIQADADLGKEFGQPMGVWDVAVDDWVLKDTPANVFKAGKHQKVPLIVGTTAGELKGPGLVLHGLIPKYLELLSAMEEANTKAYAYDFDHLPKRWKQEGVATAHATEVMYVFGCWDEKSEWDWFYGFTYAPSGAKQPDPGLSEVDRKVSEDIMAMWVQFARTGDPNVPGLVYWPEYKRASDQYLYIVDPLEVRTGFSHLQD